MEIRTQTLTEEQRSIRQMVRDVVDEHVRPFIREARIKAAEATPHSPPPAELVQKVGELGIGSIMIPERYGGIRYDVQTLAVIAEELARGGTRGGFGLTQNWKLSALIADHAAEHLQDYWFPRIMEDPTFVMAHALTEPRGASDRWLPYNAPEASMTTRAVLRDGQWVLNGQKQFISNAPTAKLFVVYACTNPSVGVMDGTSSFLVPRDTPGLTVGPQPGDVFFQDCRIPEDHLLVRDTALCVADKYFTPHKVILASAALGNGVAAYEETVAFCQSRVQGGRVIIQHQLVGAALAHMATKLESVRALNHWAARAVDEGTSDAPQVTQMAYLHAAEQIFDVCKKAVELWAGMGTVPEVGIEDRLRAATVGLHLDGTPDLQKLKIAKLLFPDTAGPYAGPVEGPPRAPAAVH